MLKFLTPYLMKDAKWYFEHDMKSVKSVYITDTDDHKPLSSGCEVEVSVYSSDKTKVIAGSAWHYQSELVEYTEAKAKEIQKELDEYWGQGPFVYFGPDGIYFGE